jgi:hypothetical protein
LADVKEAMANIERFYENVNPEDGKPFTWAREWLSDIGFEIANPVTLLTLI